MWAFVGLYRRVLRSAIRRFYQTSARARIAPGSCGWARYYSLLACLACHADQPRTRLGVRSGSMPCGRCRRREGMRAVPAATFRESRASGVPRQRGPRDLCFGAACKRLEEEEVDTGHGQRGVKPPDPGLPVTEPSRDARITFAKSVSSGLHCQRSMRYVRSVPHREGGVMRVGVLRCGGAHCRCAVEGVSGRY